MRTIAFVGTKGGVGKSVLSFAIGICASMDSSVYFADVDPQQSLAGMCERRSERVKGYDPILLEDVGRIVEAKRRLKETGFERDYLIVDTPGSFVEIIDDAVAAADVLVVPTLASPIDILAQEAVANIITKRGKSSVTLMVLNKVDTRSKITDEAMELIVPMFPNKPVWISQRVSFVRAAVAGFSAAEIDKDARTEIDNLWAGIQKIIGKIHHEELKPKKPHTRKTTRSTSGRKTRKGRRKAESV